MPEESLIALVLRTVKLWFVGLILVCNALTQAQEPAKTFRLTFPDKDWSVDFPRSDYDSSSEAITNNRYVAFFEERDPSPNRRSLAISMEPAQSVVDAVGLRELIKKKLLRANASSIKSQEHNSIPLLRYSTDGAGLLGEYGRNFVIQRVSAYFVNDSTWITITLSSNRLNKDNEEHFYSIIDAMRFVGTADPKTSFDYYHRGRPYYLQSQYHKAIEPYAMALSIELNAQSFSDTEFRNLLTELADSYGAVNRSKEFKLILDYAVTRFPSYYVYKWGLARYYANLNDLDQTLGALEKAFAEHPKSPRTPNLISETAPDPLQDPAFTRFKKNERFLKAVKEMQKQWLKK
jgi:tetratricopeptide (TPR) repeat protein